MIGSPTPTTMQGRRGMLRPTINVAANPISHDLQWNRQSKAVLEELTQLIGSFKDTRSIRATSRGGLVNCDLPEEIVACVIKEFTENNSRGAELLKGTNTEPEIRGDSLPVSPQIGRAHV